MAEHGPALMALARARLGTHAAAEEAVQEAFARFWPRRSEVADAKAYLFRCVRAAAVDAQRAGASRRRREEAAAAPEAVFEEPADDLGRALAEAVGRLPAEQAEMVTLKHWGGLTLAQAAEAAGCPPGTAASRYRAAVASLRRALDPEDFR